MVSKKGCQRPPTMGSGGQEPHRVVVAGGAWSRWHIEVLINEVWARRGAAHVRRSTTLLTRGIRSWRPCALHLWHADRTPNADIPPLPRPNGNISLQQCFENGKIKIYYNVFTLQEYFERSYQKYESFSSIWRVLVPLLRLWFDHFNQIFIR